MDKHARAVDLAKRPYLVMTTVDTTTEDHPIYFARILEIEGCFGQGATHDAAIEDLRLAMVDFFDSLLEDGLPVPQPAKLINSTLGTASQAAFTYTAQGKNQDRKLQPKFEVYQDVYLLSAPAE
ncbi:MAG: type II toxin-antitoxin system HicB family antitoxin [Chloroflexi bacterium]|nr:type II toxin-antitoxin system HicB family antitoxin [Chloroflexota bacterium]